MRPALAALVSFGLAGPAAAADAAPSPEAAWKAWIAKGEAAYAARRLATLKIEDAVYLSAGQSAWLVCEAGCRWRLEAPGTPVPIVTFSGSSALWGSADGSAELLGRAEPVALSPTRDVTAMIAQVAPGEEGLRLVVYNQDQPEAKAFKGFRFFPYAADLVVTARWEPGDLRPVDFQTSRGWVKRFYLAGHAVFTREGAEVRLPLYSAVAEAEEAMQVSAFFTDATTGAESYGVGRYLDAEVQGFPPEDVVLDFNYAYNPACARSAHFNCPVAETKLPFAVTAGEMVPEKGTD